MKTRIKKKWLEALRSGEYEQTLGKLRDERGFCVYGVLCDLHAKETGGEWDGSAYLGKKGSLPGEVAGWAGLPATDPTIERAAARPRKVTLLELNDGVRGLSIHSFKQLALVIERYL